MTCSPRLRAEIAGSDTFTPLSFQVAKNLESARVPMLPRSGTFHMAQFGRKFGEGSRTVGRPRSDRSGDDPKEWWSAGDLNP